MTEITIDEFEVLDPDGTTVAKFEHQETEEEKRTREAKEELQDFLKEAIDKVLS